MTSPSQLPPVEKLAAGFRALAPTYDTLRFLRIVALHVAGRADLRPGQQVADIGTGTGAVALTVAPRILPGGRVVGIDASPDMVARAKANQEHAGISNAEFRVGDAVRLDLPTGSFDVLFSVSTLFFLPDMEQALADWRRVLTPAGTAWITSFGPSFLEPLHGMLCETLRRHGVNPVSPPHRRVDTPEKFRTMLEHSGFTRVALHTEDLGYALRDPEERWENIVNGFEGLPLRALPPDRLAPIREEHLHALRAAAAGGALRLEVPVLLAEVGV